MCRCGTERHGLLVDLVVFGLLFHSMFLKVFSNLYDSMILSSAVQGLSLQNKFSP